MTDDVKDPFSSSTGIPSSVPRETLHNNWENTFKKSVKDKPKT